MQSKVKLTKRQIKEDKFTTFMLNAKDRLLDTWQYWVIGIVAVILIVAAGSYYVSSQSEKTQEAASRYSRAVMEYRNGQTQLALIGLEQVVDEYGGTDIAEQARFMLGAMNFEERNYAEAIEQFQNYLDKYKQNKLNRAAAYAGIAAAHENQGNYEEAAAHFEQAFDAYPRGPLAGDYMMGAMRSYLLMGDIEKARTKLDQINAEFAGTGLANRAERLFTEMGTSAS
ncbi:tetratricopeptide repeat protein [candidate division GN15 bacterium]|nr:tetratricopeptide repeat protein [candidate division GN15 bacterium]